MVFRDGVEEVPRLWEHGRDIPLVSSSERGLGWAHRLCFWACHVTPPLQTLCLI